MNRFTRMCVVGLVGLMGVVSFASAADVSIQGGGSTFANLLYQRWAAEYRKIHPNVKIDYASLGSGAGIKGITDKTFDFCGTDAPMNKAEVAKAGGAENLIEFPTVSGAVVMAYNIPGFTGELHLDGPAIADIYLGTIKNWNDPKIAAMNPGAKLPDLAIQAVHRIDGSGTTYAFTNYVCGESSTFKEKIGAGKDVEFPGGVGGKGSEGVTQVIQTTKGAVGYAETAYAVQNKLPTALVKNKDGQFVKPDAAGVSAAGEAALNEMTVPNLLKANIWNRAGAKTYPIASFTYIVVYKDLTYLKNPEKAAAMVDFLRWGTTEGQTMAASMDYAPLSPGVQKKVQAALDLVKK